MNGYIIKSTYEQNKTKPFFKNLIPIPNKINENNNTNLIKNNYTYGYSLNNNLFDPCQNSPPNEFMQKLEKRFNIYNHSVIK
jgi:hypothetical protein